MKSKSETLEIINDFVAMKEIEEGLKAYELGKGKRLEELRKELNI